MPTPVEGGGTLIDSGFNSGTTDGNIGSPWTVAKGTGGSATYSTSNPGYAPSTGALSAQSAKLTTGSNSTATTVDSATLSSLTADTAEIRWWIYTVSPASGSINYAQLVYDLGGSSGTFYLDLTKDGVIRIYCDRTNPANTTGYGTAGYHTLNATWSNTTLYQFSIRMNFTNKTYTVRRRTKPGETWTSIYKASSSVDIPMRSGSVTAMGQLRLFQEASPSGSQTSYFDEVQYANGGITDNAAGLRPAGAVQAVNRAGTY